MSLCTGHVALNVQDLDRALDFYTDVLGLELVSRSDEPGRFAFLGFGGRLVLTLWEQADRDFSNQRAGLHHLAFEAPDMATVEAVEARARGRGSTILSDGIVAHRQGAASGGLFFTDPDGTRIEVYAPEGAEAYAAPAHGPACGFF